MRALLWVLSLILLLAGATADGAEAVKIRASWIVAPSDWTPLLPEKPELMKNNGKSYVFEPMRFQGTPAVITALANNEIELGNLAFSSLALAIENAGLEDLRIVGDQFKDGTEGHYSNQFFVLRDSPIQKVEDLKGKIVATNAAGSAVDIAMHAMLRKHGLEDKRDYTVVEAPFPTMKAMLTQKKADLASFVAPFSFDPELKQRGHADDRVGRADGLPAEEPRRHGRFLGGFRAGRALVPRSQESRQGRADRGEGHQTAPGTVRGLALHQQGIFAQPGSAARSGGAAVQHRRATRPRIPQTTDRRAVHFFRFAPTAIE